MDFASIRIITADVDRLARFYELVTGTPAARPAPVFAEFRTGAGALAIASTMTVAMLGEDAPERGTTNLSSSSSSSLTWTPSSPVFVMLSATSFSSRPRCRGATGRPCSAIPTGTS